MSASFDLVRRALAEQSAAILAQIPVRPVALSLPVDGKGVRILASVEPAQVDLVPESVRVELVGRSVDVRIEARGDYEATDAQ